MTYDRAAVRKRIIEELKVVSVHEGRTIAEATDLHYDLAMGGEDLWGFLAWMQRTFGVDFSAFEARDFNLNEPPNRSHTLFGKRKFKSMTLGALLDAVEAGVWKAQ